MDIIPPTSFLGVLEFFLLQIKLYKTGQDLVSKIALISQLHPLRVYSAKPHVIATQPSTIYGNTLCEYADNH